MAPDSPFYCYTFSEDLVQEWDWKETQSEQSAVLAYLEHVADKFDLRRDIRFGTWVEEARYDEAAQRWSVETSTGVRASAPFLICAVGALSTPNLPDIPGIHDFAGECYHTAQWPHEPVSFEGKRVGVIGTGSSGIQSIPEIAKRAAHVTVFQRTPQYAFPAGNRPFTSEEMAQARASWKTAREKMLAHPGGFPFDTHSRAALETLPRSAVPSTRSCGSAAASDSSWTATTTSPSARKPTEPWPTSCATRSARSCATPRPRRS